MALKTDDLYKIKEIMQHISTLFDHYREDSAYFDEYADGVLNQDHDKALFCFRDLVNNLPRKVNNEQRLQRVPSRLTTIQNSSRLCVLNRG
jgi:hypothetical protein